MLTKCSKIVNPTNGDFMLEKNLKVLRKKNGLTQEDLASSLAVSRQAVCMWEKGERTPRVTMLTEISKLFDISLDHMVNGEMTSLNNKLKKKRR